MVMKEFSVTSIQVFYIQSLANGLSAKDIAKELKISRRTVEKNIETLYFKFGARNRCELVAEGFRHNLVK